MNDWVNFLKELEVAAVESGIIIQSFGDQKPEAVYQEEFDLDN